MNVLFVNANSSLELNLSQILSFNQSANKYSHTKILLNIYGIASGMAYLHSHDVVHRCLCPDNIYLDDLLLPKIGDFGFSTRFTNLDSLTYQSLSGSKGTPIYMAPEGILSN